jgi:hypothetical protein
MQLLAVSTIGEAFFYLILWVALIGWMLARLTKKCGAEGIVKDAAKRSVTKVVSRWIK